MLQCPSTGEMLPELVVNGVNYTRWYVDLVAESIESDRRHAEFMASEDFKRQAMKGESCK